MQNKKILPIALVVLIIGTLVYLFMTQNQNQAPVNVNTNTDTSADATRPADEGSRVMPPTTTEEQPIEKLKVANFTGTLNKVDTGCFADGECYVLVDGKHVTALMGWSRETVGSVIGVGGFGDLESHIGRKVEVYAQDKGDGTYTLYGNSGFYIKLVE